MKKLTFTKPHNLSQLHDELLVAVPALQPIGEGLERRAVITVEGSREQPDLVVLYVPDDADETAISNVVNQHSPRAPVAPPNFRALMDAIEAVDMDAPTNFAEFRAMQKLLMQRIVMFLKARASLR